MNELTESQIFELERPHPSLLKLYFIQSILTGPGFFLLFPVLFFRYHTLKYKFDDEGISMSWGILFRHQVNLTYARIQDIHLNAGLIQRWFGLGDLKIQTASGSAAAEMTIEGFLEFDEIKNFIYSKMRGLKDRQAGAKEQATTAQSGDITVPIDVLDSILAELRASRKAIEQLCEKGEGDQHV